MRKNFWFFFTGSVVMLFLIFSGINIFKNFANTTYSNERAEKETKSIILSNRASLKKEYEEKLKFSSLLSKTLHQQKKIQKLHEILKEKDMDVERHDKLREKIEVLYYEYKRKFEDSIDRNLELQNKLKDLGLEDTKHEIYERQMNIDHEKKVNMLEKELLEKEERIQNEIEMSKREKMKIFEEQNKIIKELERKVKNEIEIKETQMQIAQEKENKIIELEREIEDLSNEQNLKLKSIEDTLEYTQKYNKYLLKVHASNNNQEGKEKEVISKKIKFGNCNYVFKQIINFEDLTYSYYIDDYEISKHTSCAHQYVANNTNLLTKPIYNYSPFDHFSKWEKMIKWWVELTDKYEIPYVISGSTLLSYCMNDEKFFLWDDSLEVILGDHTQTIVLNEAFQKSKKLVSYKSGTKEYPMIITSSVLQEFNGVDVFMRVGDRVSYMRGHETSENLLKNVTVEDRAVYQFYNVDSIISEKARESAIHEIIYNPKEMEKFMCSYFIDASLCEWKEPKKKDKNVIHRCLSYQNGISRGRKPHLIGIKEGEKYDDYPKVNICGFGLRVNRKIKDVLTRKNSCKILLKDYYGTDEFENFERLRKGRRKGREKVRREHFEMLQNVLTKDEMEYIRSRII